MKPCRRVLLCCEQYVPSVGGVQEVMRQIAERLAQRGFDVTVVTSTHPRRNAIEVLNGVRIVSFSITGNRVQGIAGPVSAYQSFLKEEEYDAILIKAGQQWTFDVAVDVIGEIRGHKVFIPCGFSGLHDPRYASYFEAMPKWLRLFDELVFYSGTYQDIEFARAHGLENLNLIPNGVDEREFQDVDAGDIRSQLTIAKEDDLLLSVGSMIMAKGHWEVVRAFRKVRLQRPATLVINGNCPHGGGISSLKRTIKHALTGRWPISWEAALVSLLPGKKVLITNLPRHQLVKLYKASNLFVFASHVEYSPLVLFEASAAGLPFISSSAGNSTEIAQWVGSGTIVERESSNNAAVAPKVLAGAIEQALSDPEVLKAIGARARRNTFEQGFFWGRIVDAYMKVLAK